MFIQVVKPFLTLHLFSLLFQLHVIVFVYKTYKTYNTIYVMHEHKYIRCLEAFELAIIIRI